MMKVKIRWDELEALEAAAEGGGDGILAAARVILEASNQIAPYDTGAMIGTGTVDLDLETITGSVYYDSPYAAALHQNPQYNFKNGRRGRYLRTAFIQAKPHVIQYFGDALKLRFSKRKKPFPAV